MSKSLVRAYIMYQENEALREVLDILLDRIELLEQKLSPVENEVENSNDCEHEEHENGVCCDCGEVMEMSYAMEHDSGDMER